MKITRVVILNHVAGSHAGKNKVSKPFKIQSPTTPTQLSSSHFPPTPSNKHFFCSHFHDDSRIDAFISERLHGIEEVIVHCYLSQQRGPFAASRLAKRLKDLNREGQPTILVMSKGFRRFGMLYGTNPQLCEGFIIP
jgi:hypothetical protein